MSDALALTPASAVMLIAGGLVVVHAVQRFSAPKTVAASTTQLRFQWSRFLYVLSSLALFLLLKEALGQPGVLKFLNNGADVTGPAASLPAPLLAALCLSVLLPNLPILKTLDAKLLDWFQWLGSIPTEVRRLAGELDARRLSVTPADLARIRDLLDHDDDLPRELGDFLTEDVTDKAGMRLTRILSIYARLDAMRTDRACAGFFAEFDEDWAALSAEVRRYAGDSAHYFRLAARGPDEAAADRHKKLGIETYNRLALFLAQALLRSGWTPRSIETRIRALGFPAEVVVRSATPWNLIAQLVVLCLAFFVVATALLAQFTPARSLPHLGMILFAVIAHVGAAVAVILPKRRWPFAQRHPGGDRPYPAYLLSAAAAVAVSTLAAFLFEAAGIAMPSPNPGGLNGAWVPLNNPLILMSGAAALALAYLCDDRPPPDRSEFTERAIEGLFCALFLAGVAWCIVVLLPHMAPPEGRWWLAVAMSFLIGALLGAFVPASFRRAPETPAAPLVAPGPLAAAAGG